MIKAIGRTGTLLIWLTLVMLVALLICAGRPGGESMFVIACSFLGTLGLGQAAKSTLEAGATGVGLKNAVKAMVGETTPPVPKDPP